MADCSAVNTSFVHVGSSVNHNVNFLRLYFALPLLVITVGRMVHWLGFLLVLVALGISAG